MIPRTLVASAEERTQNTRTKILGRTQGYTVPADQLMWGYK